MDPHTKIRWKRTQLAARYSHEVALESNVQLNDFGVMRELLLLFNGCRTFGMLIPIQINRG